MEDTIDLVYFTSGLLLKKKVTDKMTRSDVNLRRDGQKNFAAETVYFNSTENSFQSPESGFDPVPSMPTLPAFTVENTQVMHSNMAMETDLSPMCDDFAQLRVEEHTCNPKGGSNCSKQKTHQAAKHLLLFLTDVDGDTSLHISIMQEDIKKSAYIISCAPDFMHLNIFNNLGQSPAHLAALTNSSTILRKLICAGADISCQDKYGNTPLHIACKHGYLEVVKQLLRPVDYLETLANKYAIPFTAIPQNMNVKNYDGLTCLHLAVMQNDVEIVRMLMEAGADANFGDSKSGRTALHVAAELDKMDMVSLLISNSATDVDIRTYAGHNAAQLAYSRGNVEVTKLLFNQSISNSFGFYSYQLDDSSDDSDIDVDS